MREGAIQFSGEDEVRIGARGHAAPFFSDRRFDMAVEGCVDFDQVEEAGEILDASVCLERRRIDDPLPILVRKTGDADFDIASGEH